MPLILTPFRFHNFRLWIAANSVSVIGTWMQVLAANWLLLVATGSAAQMGLGMLVQAVPTLLLGPLAGTLADRLPARPLLTTTQVLQGAVSACLGLIAITDGATAPAIYAAMLASGVVAAFENPALGRFGSLMVDRDHLGPALAAGSLSSSFGRMIGMASGGALIAALGPGPLFLVNAASFGAVVAVLYLLRPARPGATAPEHTHVTERDPDDSEAPPTTTLAGLRYVLRDPLVLVTLALAFLLGSLGRNYQVTMATMSAGPLGTGPDGYGQLSTVFAVGTVVGGLLAARAGRFRPRHLVLVGLAMSVLQGLSGLSPGLWSFAAVLLPIAAAAVVVDTVVATRLQLDQPLAVRGRVLAVVSATGAVAGAVGAPLLGLLSDVLGARGALGIAGVITTLGCVAAGVGYGVAQRRSARARVRAAEPVGVTVPAEPVDAMMPAEPADRPPRTGVPTPA